MEDETLVWDPILGLLGGQAQPVDVPGGNGELLWRPRPEFTAYLRECRERLNLSLREAAEQVGISFTRLQKMETGGRYKPPNLALLSKLAVLYRVTTAELLREAGFELAAPDAVKQDLDFELEFDVLAFHPALNPRHMDRDWRYAYAPLVKQQWVDFAYKFEALFAREPNCLERILDAQDRYMSPPPESDPEARKIWTLVAMLRSGALFVEGERPEFGPYLRWLRKQKGVTLQVAAREMGMSYGVLHRLETGERAVGTIEMLRPIVTYYGLALEETMARLGMNEDAMEAMFRHETSNLDFMVLMEDPDLRPVGMTPHWMEKISAAQKRHWVDFAQNFSTWLGRGKPGVKGLVAEHRRLEALGTAAGAAGTGDKGAVTP